MDTHDKSHSNMTSEEWQQQIDTTMSDITAKESRLAMFAHAKAAAILEPKKLLALEEEELRLPTIIESLRKRLPLLDLELEAALRTEAEERYRQVETQVAEAAARVNKSTVGIREAMQKLLALVSEAHVDWDTEAALFAEAEYLRVRFGLSASQGRAGDRFSPVELRIFIQQLERDFRHVVPTPWDGLRSEWQETERRKEGKRRADEEASRPRNRPYIHYHRDPAPRA